MSSGLTETYVTGSVTNVYPCLAAVMDFSGSAPVRLWSGITSQSLSDDFGGGVYYGVGTLGGISGVTETTDVSAKGLELTLSGIKSEYVSLALNNPYRNRKMAVYLLLFNESRTTYEQVTMFRGRMDQMTIDDSGESSVIKLKCENRLIDLNKSFDSRYTDPEQKAQYPDDCGLEFVANLGEVYWGNSAPKSTANSSTDTGDGDGVTFIRPI